MRGRALALATLAAVLVGCASVPRPDGGDGGGGAAPAAFYRDLETRIRDSVPPLPAQRDDEWNLTYFHLAGGDDLLLGALESALAGPGPGVDRDGESVHFFAAALSRRPAALASLQARAADGGAGTRLAPVVRAARQFSSPAPDSPESVDALWAEYRATGERAPLDAIVGVLAAVPTPDNRELIGHAALSLARNVPVHGELALLEQRRAAATGRQQRLLDVLVDSARRLRDEAKSHADRGDNLLREGQVAAAVAEFEAALRRYPAHHQAYTSLGRHYERAGNLPLALRSSGRALALSGDDPFCLTNHGRVLYRLRRYPEAMRVTERALAADPTNPYAHYLAGLIRQGLGDRGGAVSSLTRSIELDPDADCSRDARRRLSMMHVVAPDDSTNLAAMLQRREYDAIELRLAQLLESREKDADGKSRLLAACEQLGKPSRKEKAFATRLSQLQAWLAARPDSHFARVCTGICLVEYGYFGRGGGYAPTVTEQGWRLFRERLEAGREHLEKAFAVDPSDPVVPRVLIWAATGLALERQEVDTQLERARSADPAFLEVHLTMLTYLLPRWHGSHEEMLAYAREAATAAPPGSAVPRVVDQAHHLIWKDLETAGLPAADYFKDPAVWEEVQRIEVGVLRDFPASTQIRNWYAKYAYLHGAYGLAREQFALIGEAWYDRCWGSYRDFQEARSRVAAAD